MVQTYTGLARSEADKNGLSPDHSAVMEIIGKIADEDTSTGSVDTKIQLAAAMLERVERESAPTIDETIRLTRHGIKAGVFDLNVEEMISLLTRRRDVLAAQRVSELEVGQYIKIADQCRPKMLAGQRVEVVGFDRDSVKVRLLFTYSAKWRADSTITLPRTLVGEVVS